MTSCRTRSLLLKERAMSMHRTLHDSLTNLPNRTLFNRRVDEALRGGRAGEGDIGVLVLDLEGFKDINDTFGSAYGDELLRQVGERLASALGQNTLLARVGGDEFAVLVPAVPSVERAASEALRIRGALRAPFRLFEVDVSIETTGGVAFTRAHGNEAAVLLERAEVALRHAKGNHLDIHVFDHAIDRQVPARLTMLKELRNAIESDQLVVHYQPKVALSTSELAGAEALVRWKHPSIGVIPPDAFIPLAEHTKLIGPLTDAVLDLALQQVRVWSDEGRPIPVSVNISARNLVDLALPERVSAFLDRHEVAPELLKIEITESALMSDPARARGVLEHLSLLGISISLDDFGSGYTSLGQLSGLPISELKMALHSRGCSCGLKPPDSSSDLAM